MTKQVSLAARDGKALRRVEPGGEPQASKSETEAADPAIRGRQIEKYAGLGVGDAEIALLFGLERAALRRDYRRELARGRIIANALVARALFRRAIGSGAQSASAAVFWLKNQAGWREAAASDDAGRAGESARRRTTFRIDDAARANAASVAAAAASPAPATPESGEASEE